MAVYTIADLHLSFGADKPMNVFNGWQNYEERVKANWLETVRPEDTVVLAGDFSWGMSLQDTLPDFRFIDGLPGEKLLVKGNHDYWWVTRKKMDAFFAEHGLSTLHILHNDCYAYEGYGICGTRGWVNMDQDEPANAKVIAREAQRLEVSLQAAEAQGLTPIAFLHYPPIYGASCCWEMLEVLWRHHVADCWYGHVHGKAHSHAINGERDGVNYHLISGDYVHFIPQKIM